MLLILTRLQQAAQQQQKHEQQQQQQERQVFWQQYYRRFRVENLPPHPTPAGRAAAAAAGRSRCCARAPAMDKMQTAGFKPKIAVVYAQQVQLSVENKAEDATD